MLKKLFSKVIKILLKKKGKVLNQKLKEQVQKLLKRNWQKHHRKSGKTLGYDLKTISISKKYNNIL